MELPKVIIRGDYNDFLRGKEVVAAILEPPVHDTVHLGEHIIAFKDSIAAAITVPVPKTEQSHYIGIEGTVTGIGVPHPDKDKDNASLIMITKL
jgi:hypothetical protein